jgi:hypothetical protein
MDGLTLPYWRQSREVLAACLTRVQADRVRAVPDSDLAVGLEIVEEALADLLQVLTLELEETQGGHT